MSVIANSSPSSPGYVVDIEDARPVDAGEEGEGGAPIRVLHVLEATLGGTLRYLENIAEATRSTPIVSGLAFGTSRADSRLAPYLEKIRALGWATFSINLRREINLSADLQAFFQLRDAIRTFQPDILHCHSSKAGAIGRAAAALRFRKLDSLYSPHALAVSLGWKYRYIEKILARWTDGFIAVSESERSEIASLALARETNVKIVYPSIDSDYFTPLDRAEARREVGLDDGPVVIGIGRLTAQKNPESFLAIAQQVHQRRPDVRLLWIGSGEEESAFREQIERRGLQGVVRQIPWQHDVRQYIAAANVLLGTSRFESFGYVVAEALSMGIPAVASRVTGTCDILNGALQDWMYRMGDHDAAADLVLALLDDPARADAVGVAGRAAVSRRFSSQQMRASLLESYADCVEARRSGELKRVNK